MFEQSPFVLADPPPEAFALTPADGFAPLLFVLAAVLIRQGEAQARLWLLLALPMLLGFALGLDTSALPEDGGTPQHMPPEFARTLSTGFLGVSGLILLGGAGLLAGQTLANALFYPRLARVLCLPVILLPLAWTLQKLAFDALGRPSSVATSVGPALSLALALAILVLAGQFLVSVLRRISGPAPREDD